jgi:hypothetical protein
MSDPLTHAEITDLRVIAKDMQNLAGCLNAANPSLAILKAGVLALVVGVTRLLDEIDNARAVAVAECIIKKGKSA